MTPNVTPGPAYADASLTPLTPTKRKATTQGQRQQAPDQRQSIDRISRELLPSSRSTTDELYHHRLKKYLDKRFDTIEQSIAELKENNANVNATLNEIKDTLTINDPYAD